MKTLRCLQLGLLMLGSFCARAQTPPAPAPEAANSNATNLSLVLSNNAVLVLSQARGVEASAVKVRFSDSMSGRFEIQPAEAVDLQREAELLSRSFGTNIAVIVDEATSDGRLRTNYVFRGGTVRRTVAPIVNNVLPPGGRRMYVWPETSKLGVPMNVRLVQQAN